MNNNLCRICLEKGLLSSIFLKNYNNIFISDMVQMCSKVMVQHSDGLSDQICSNCIYKLEIAYHFKQTSESSDLQMRQHLGLELPRKYKDASIMTDPMVLQKTTLIKRCNKCKPEQRKRCRRKPDSEKMRRGPKPKPKKVHECSQCHKEFRCQTQLDMHVRTHTGDKPFGCMFCPKQFSQKHNLTIHLRIHTGEKPYQCEMCSKTFSTQGNLSVHLKTHTGQKDHICEVCKKAFVTSSELNRHMTKHTGFKKFKCDLCDKGFTQKRELKLHKMRKHTMSNEADDQRDNFNTIDIVNVDDVKILPSTSKDPTHCKSDVNLTIKNQGLYLFSHSVFGQTLT
ncbi:zinc finger protein 420 isoform X1 [Pieris rapae]|uniref:zinc finger protein 420 isoform X1 n=1 Tax=Pieris rapae TaxID=64459 RepID=UPI001E27C7D4|nr:zinc finger protein 420 isoform X1 [Pieris rapae]